MRVHFGLGDATDAGTGDSLALRRERDGEAARGGPDLHRHEGQGITGAMCDGSRARLRLRPACAGEQALRQTNECGFGWVKAELPKAVRWPEKEIGRHPCEMGCHPKGTL